MLAGRMPAHPDIYDALTKLTEQQLREKGLKQMGHEVEHHVVRRCCSAFQTLMPLGGGLYLLDYANISKEQCLVGEESRP